MKDKLAALRRFQPVFFTIYLGCAALCLCGFLIALITCIDRADEWFNALRYQGDWRQDLLLYHNEWKPFKGGFIDRVMQIPHGLYVAFVKFPVSSMVGVITFPLLVLMIPLHDFFAYGDFGFLLYGWAPVIVGAAVFTCAVLVQESYALDKKGIEKVEEGEI